MNLPRFLVEEDIDLPIVMQELACRELSHKHQWPLVYKHPGRRLQPFRWFGQEAEISLDTRPHQLTCLSRSGGSRKCCPKRAEVEVRKVKPLRRRCQDQCELIGGACIGNVLLSLKGEEPAECVLNIHDGIRPAHVLIEDVEQEVASVGVGRNDYIFLQKGLEVSIRFNKPSEICRREMPFNEGAKVMYGRNDCSWIRC